MSTTFILASKHIDGQVSIARGHPVHPTWREGQSKACPFSYFLNFPNLRIGSGWKPAFTWQEKKRRAFCITEEDKVVVHCYKDGERKIETN